MSLRDLASKNVHLLYTNSSLIEMNIYDILKDSCGATLESVYNVNTKADCNEMLNLLSVQSYLAEKWLFIIDYSKLKDFVKSRKNIFMVDTACFLVKVKNYKDFKEFKELISAVNELYLTVIRGSDIAFLLKEYKLSPKLLDFVSKSYSRDPEKVFVLRDELRKGLRVETSKDIVSVCGTSAGSVVHLAMKLLENRPKTVRGLNMVCKNRIQEIEDLVDAYGLSSTRNFLLAAVKDILDIKVLYMNGIIYKSVRNLPECYDEKRLSRYGYYYSRIVEELLYPDILRLYLSLRSYGAWVNRSVMLDFIYGYFKGFIKEAQ